MLYEFLSDGLGLTNTPQSETSNQENNDNTTSNDSEKKGYTKKTKKEKLQLTQTLKVRTLNILLDITSTWNHSYNV